MMRPTIEDTLVTLVPVMVGGAIGLLSSISAGVTLHVLKSRSERAAKRKEKLERFVLLAEEMSSVVNRMSAAKDYGFRVLLHKQMAELTTIASLYLPELKSEAWSIANHSREFAHTVHQNFKAIAAQGASNPDLDKAFEEQQMAVLNAWQRLAKQAEKLALKL